MSPRIDEPHGQDPTAPPTEDLPPRHPGDKLDATVAHSARTWNYWLGGKDHFAVDRLVGEQIRTMYPHIVDLARADRAFLGRAVRYLAAECGIRQFLDIGTGLPTVDNTHEVAQRVVPESRIVYVDNDPPVLAHARALLTSSPEGACDYLDTDLHDPDDILAGAAKTLDFSQPVVIMLLGIVHFIEDDDEAQAILNRLTDAVPPSSFLAIAHFTNAVHGAMTDEAAEHWNTFGKPAIRTRTPEQIGCFFHGLELIEPGIVSCSRWRPEPTTHGAPEEVEQFCGVGRKS